MRLPLVLAVLLVAQTAQAEVVSDMTAAKITEAITYGAKEKKLEAYSLGGPSLTQNRPGPVARFTTPFLRVARASSEAKRTYKEFSESTVTPEMIAPEVAIIARAFVPTGSKVPDSTKAVVMFAADGKPMQPDRIEELEEGSAMRWGPSAWPTA